MKAALPACLRPPEATSMKAALRCRSTSPFAIWSSQAAQQRRRLVLSMAAATGFPKSSLFQRARLRGHSLAHHELTSTAPPLPVKHKYKSEEYTRSRGRTQLLQPSYCGAERGDAQSGGGGCLRNVWRGRQQVRSRNDRDTRSGERPRDPLLRREHIPMDAQWAVARRLRTLHVRDK